MKSVFLKNMILTYELDNNKEVQTGTRCHICVVNSFFSPSRGKK